MDDDPVTAAVGENVRRARENRGMSQTQLAEEASVHKNTILGLEKGKQSVRINTLYDISRALDVPIYDLLEMDEEISVGRHVVAGYKKSPWAEIDKPTVRELETLESLNHLWVRFVRSGHEISPEQVHYILLSVRAKKDA